jgi:alcohol dehydrogenase
VWVSLAKEEVTEKMLANVFRGKGDVRVEEVERPRAGAGEVVMRVTLTTVCGTDLHIVRGEYPVRPGLVIGHEPVGVVSEIGPGVEGYEVGDRVRLLDVVRAGRVDLTPLLTHSFSLEEIGALRGLRRAQGGRAKGRRAPLSAWLIPNVYVSLRAPQLVLARAPS